MGVGLFRAICAVRAFALRQTARHGALLRDHRLPHPPDEISTSKITLLDRLIVGHVNRDDATRNLQGDRDQCVRR